MMKKTALSLIAAALLLGALTLPAFGTTGAYVTDEAALLDAYELSQLNEEAQRVSELYECDVAVLTVESLNGEEARAFTEAAYFDYGVGYGENLDGALLMLSIEERDYWISTYGYGNTAFTDYGQELLEDAFKDGLGGVDDFFGGFSAFISTCEDFLEQARAGTPVDEYYDDGYYEEDYWYNDDYGDGYYNDDYWHDGGSYRSSGSGMSFGSKALIVLAVSLGPALIFCWLQVSKMKTAKAARSAHNYIPQNGMRITRQRDQFLYRTVSRVKIPQQTHHHHGGGGGGGGGSRGGGTTVSSGGFSGRGGKF